MKYLLFLGCTIPRRLPFLEASARKVLETLNIKTQEFPDASCCPEPTLKFTMNPDTYYALAARNLSLAENENLPILTLCNGCYYSLKKIRQKMQDDDTRKRINEILKESGHEYSNGVDIYHIAHLLHERILQIKKKSKVLIDINVAVHNGCHLVFEEDIKKMEDPAKILVIDDIVKAVGATSVGYQTKQVCCGGNLKGVAEEEGLKLIREKLIDIKNAGADCITLQCPFCFINYDMKHSIIEKVHGTVPKIPVLSLTEILSLSFGYAPEDIGLNYHITPTEDAIKKILT